jgi:hypothetical protein
MNKEVEFDLFPDAKAFENGSMGEDFNGVEWLYFHWAADIIGDTLAIPPSAAQAHLRKLCASGEVRAVVGYGDEIPEHVEPSRWREVDVDLSPVGLYRMRD